MAERRNGRKDATAKVSVRPATASDVPAIAAIGLRAFANEPIYAHFFPRREQYPEDYLRSFVDEAHRFLVTPGHVIMVAEVDGEAEVDGGAEEGSSSRRDEGPQPDADEPRAGTRVMAGYATFIRHGPSKELEAWNPGSVANTLRRIALRFRTLLTSALWPNRAAAPDVAADYYKQAARLHAPHLGASQSRIDFRTLAVDPAHQGRGYGERLVEWCGVAAWSEDVPVFGDATTKGLPLYLRNGCEDIGKIHLPKQVVDVGRQHPLELEALDVVVLKWKA